MRAVNPIAMLFGRLGMAPGSHRLVLPRVLRRPFRMLTRMEWRPPAHAEVKLGAALLVAAVVGGVFMGGHVQNILEYLSVKGGLTLSAVRITGQTETSELAVLDKLAIADGTSLATFDVGAARERIETLPWVTQATLAKIYPSTLQVVITEKAAFAMWHHDNVTSLIDESGKVITDTVDPKYSSLPMVIGAGAAQRAAEAVTMIAAEPTLKSRVDAAVLVGGRRWTIMLENGPEILLPESEPAAALHRVAELDADYGLLSRDITRIDLRNPAQLVVRMSDEGAARRDAMLKRNQPGAKRGGAA
jgi:cell division protein FtsQ